MKNGQMVVLDSSNTAAIIADALDSEAKAEEVTLPTDSGKPVTAAPEEKPAAEVKPEAKTDDAEDEADENGLTAAEREGLTAKMQKAIGKKHRALKEAEEFAAHQFSEKQLAVQNAERLQREIERLKVQGQPPARAAKEETKPGRANFKTDEEYANALIDYKVEQKMKEREDAARQQSEQERQEQIRKDAGARIDKAREFVPDFNEVVSAAEIEVPNYIAGYMQESDMIAELGYHFAKNPDVLKGLQKMTPARALVEIGKIESKLQPFAPKSETSRKPDAATATAAPTATEPSKPKPKVAAPITPLNGGSGTQVEKDPRDMSYAETKEAWARQRNVNLTRRQRH